MTAYSAYTKDASDVRYQRKLTAGTGISIDSDNVISATGGDGWKICDLENHDWTYYIYEDQGDYSPNVENVRAIQFRVIQSGTNTENFAEHIINLVQARDT